MLVTFVSMAIVAGYTAAFKSIELAKSKMVAVSLANGKMEIIRNMSYDDLATEHGLIYPSGRLLDDETLDRNGFKYNVHTVISYVDDPFDGNASGTIAGKPTDIYPYDYKKVEITVGKVGKNSQLAKLVTNVGAKAAETPSNTGIINLCVIDSQSQPVVEANIVVTNIMLTPPVNIVALTGSDGCIMLPKLPPDEHNDYHLLVSKDGYSVSSTYPRTDQNPNALIPDVNVIAQQVTSSTLVIDRTSTLQIGFIDQNNQPVPNVSFTLESSKLIYNNPDTFKFSKQYISDGSGNVTIAGLEFDDYKIKDVASMSVVSVSTTQPIHLPSGANLAVKVFLSNSSSNPAIYNFSPMSSLAGDKISITVNGSNFNNGASVKIVNASTGQVILGTNVDVAPHAKIVADLDLMGAELGTYNLVVTNTDGQSITQAGSFSIEGQE